MSYLSTTDFFEDKDFVDRYQYTMRTGELDLSWMNAATEKVQCEPQNARRGLTFRDFDVGSYGFTDMPELIRQNRSFAPRGAEIPAGVPDLQAEVNRKSEVWAYNIEGYYEEAMSRQWNATTDVPWEELAQVRAARRDRQGLLAAAHVSHRSRDDRHRCAGEVDGPPQRRVLRGEELHRHAGHGRGAPRRGLPQARPHHRLGPDARQQSPTSATSSSCATPTASPKRR